MRVKVGEQWFDATKDTPIMVVLSDADKRNIAYMLPEATMYAVFADDSPLSRDEKLSWMHGDDGLSPFRRDVNKVRGGPAPRRKSVFA